MDLETSSAVLAAADVAHQGLRSRDDFGLRFFFLDLECSLGCIAANATTLHVLRQAFREEGASTVHTRLEILVIIVEGRIVIALDATRVNCRSEPDWCFRAWPALAWRLLFLIDVPLLATCLEVNVKTGRAVLPTADVAYQSLWSLGDFNGLNNRSGTLAKLQVLD